MRRLKIFANLFLLTGALFFTAIFFTFKYRPDFVNAIGQSVIDTYMAKHRSESEKALKRLKSGDFDTISNLLLDWEDFSKGDRVYPLKRQLFFALAQSLLAANRYNDLLFWAEKWHAADDRDIDAIAYRAEAIHNTTGRREQGLQILAQQWRLFPKNILLTEFYRNAVGEPEFQAALAEVNAP